MDISQITDQLYIAAHPRAEAADTLRQMKVSLILNMIFFRPADVYRRPPFRMLTLPTFDSIFLPMPIAAFKKGVAAALPAMEDGESVLVYCRKGRHRSVAMAAAILIARDRTADEAMQLITSKRLKADPYAWHIQRRIRKFEKVWRDSLVMA